MRIVRIGAIGTVFIAICILSTSASAAALGPGAKMSGADPVYGSLRCTGGTCTATGSGTGSGSGSGSGSGIAKTCSAHAANCAKRHNGSPMCASARASCMRTGVFQGLSGRDFYGIARQ
jgi:hypothetical protein